MTGLFVAPAGAGDWAGASWLWLWGPIGFYMLVSFTLWVVSDSHAKDRNFFRGFFGGIGESLARFTGYPGWAMAGVLTALLALLIAVIGFYWDVAWHVDLGRDQQVFTPSHVMILVGLGGLNFAALIATVFANIEKAPVGFSRSGVRIPYTAVLLSLMGYGAVASFPLDVLWHNAYGLDLTLWSPPHLQLLSGGAFATFACWLMIAEGRRHATSIPRPTRLGRVIHITTLGAMLVGMTTFEAEFDFGLSGYQALYLPILITAAATSVLVAARIALGRGGALKTTVAYLILRLFLLMAITGSLDHSTLRFPLYLPTALAVEVAAHYVGVKKRGRFALAAGASAGTLGLLGELAWIPLSGWGPPIPALLPKIAVLGPITAVAAATLGAGIARAFARNRDRIPLPALGLAAVALIGALAYPLPRNVGDVSATIRLIPAGERANVEVILDPPDAAEGATVFGIGSWQGGGIETAGLTEVGPGRYRSTAPVPITGNWKTTVGLQRGDEVMVAPVYLPEDRGGQFLGADVKPVPAVPAIPERHERFVSSPDLLLRESHEGPPWPAAAGWGTLVVLMALYLGIMAWIARQVWIDEDRAPSSPDTPSGLRAPASPAPALGLMPGAGAWR
ncbi:MAG: hypothetical protein ACRDJF_02905 [Actinomycetota bacterium]